MLTGLDIFIFFGFLILVMGIGVYVGSKESNSEDYFLAGKTIPWYAVAGSIFGTNISANHLVGMLGIGFSIGFAQTHFELGAAVALLLLAYVFLPIYMKLNVFTLSEYLEKRFRPTSSLSLYLHIFSAYLSPINGGILYRIKNLKFITGQLGNSSQLSLWHILLDRYKLYLHRFWWPKSSRLD